ncbi:hypothetical protein BpHYR1_008877 [Brachionus plicatilis]|uniref:Uncharacterized protein n=1 Tax=Brachionus plicatilis TaxID=10195 RepID=A0A3M7P7M6_BRAPC|nr:hypothetical protein BpHYR1_008877 [Brachionus plicatilis]
MNNRNLYQETWFYFHKFLTIEQDFSVDIFNFHLQSHCFNSSKISYLFLLGIILVFICAELKLFKIGNLRQASLQKRSTRRSPMELRGKVLFQIIST